MSLRAARRRDLRERAARVSRDYVDTYRGPVRDPAERLHEMFALVVDLAEAICRFDEEDELRERLRQELRDSNSRMRVPASTNTPPTAATAALPPVARPTDPPRR